MKTKRNTKTAMTLRLDEGVADAIDSVSYDLRMSKTQWIRRAINHGLSHSQQHELPLLAENPAIQRALSR